MTHDNIRAGHVMGNVAPFFRALGFTFTYFLGLKAFKMGITFRFICAFGVFPVNALSLLCMQGI